MKRDKIAVLLVMIMLCSLITACNKVNIFDRDVAAGIKSERYILDVDDIYEIYQYLNKGYIVGNKYVAFSSYPYNSSPSLQLVYDILTICDIYGEIDQYKATSKMIIESIPTEEKELFSSNDIFMYSDICAMLNIKDIDLISRYVSSHFDEDSALFYNENSEEALSDKLVATYNVLRAIQCLDIDFPRLEDIKNCVLELYQDNSIFVTPSHGDNMYDAMFGDAGTIIQILYNLGLTSKDCGVEDDRLEWLKVIATNINASSEIGLLGVWLRFDCEKVNKEFFCQEQGLIDFGFYDGFVNNDFLDVFQHGETYLIDSQLLASIVETSRLIGRALPFQNEVTGFINRSVETGFSQYKSTTPNMIDLFYGVSIAEAVEFPYDKLKFEMLIQDCIDIFADLDCISSTQLLELSYLTQIIMNFHIELKEDAFSAIKRVLIQYERNLVAAEFNEINIAEARRYIDEYTLLVRLCDYYNVDTKSEEMLFELLNSYPQIDLLTSDIQSIYFITEYLKRANASDDMSFILSNIKKNIEEQVIFIAENDKRDILALHNEGMLLIYQEPVSLAMYSCTLEFLNYDNKNVDEFITISQSLFARSPQYLNLRSLYYYMVLCSIKGIT